MKSNIITCINSEVITKLVITSLFLHVSNNKACYYFTIYTCNNPDVN